MPVTTDSQCEYEDADPRPRLLRSFLGQLFSSDGPFERFDHSIEDDPSLWMIIWRQNWKRGTFRVWHEPHHVSFSVADTGDIVHGAVGVRILRRSVVFVYVS